MGVQNRGREFLRHPLKKLSRNKEEFLLLSTQEGQTPI
jgi:hypothetical protein